MQLPPINRNFPYIELRKEVGSEDIEISLPTGDSFECTLEQTKLYLLQQGYPELRREKALDWLWNFYAIRFHNHLQDYKIETLEAPTYPDVTGPRPLEDISWIIEPGRVK